MWKIINPILFRACHKNVLFIKVKIFNITYLKKYPKNVDFPTFLGY